LIIEYTAEDLDVIFVEASGMANPITLIELIKLINITTKNIIDFKGTVCLVDGTSLHKIITANMVKNQIIYSELILINKMDLINKEQILTTLETLRKYNSDAYIFPTSFGKIPRNKLETLSYSENHRSTFLDSNSCEQKVTIPAEGFSVEKLHEFCLQVNPYTDRIKGFINLDSVRYFEFINNELIIHEFTVQATPIIILVSVFSDNLKTRTEDIYKAIFQ